MLYPRDCQTLASSFIFFVLLYVMQIRTSMRRKKRGIHVHALSCKSIDMECIEEMEVCIHIFTFLYIFVELYYKLTAQ